MRFKANNNQYYYTERSNEQFEDSASEDISNISKGEFFRWKMSDAVFIVTKSDSTAIKGKLIKGTFWHNKFIVLRRGLELNNFLKLKNIQS
jgi:hypothetical protein